MGAPMAPVARGPTAEQNSFFSWRQCDISQASAWSNMLNIYNIYIYNIYNIYIYIIYICVCVSCIEILRIATHVHNIYI